MLTKYGPIIMVGLWHYNQSGVTELLIKREPHYGRMCFKPSCVLRYLELESENPEVFKYIIPMIGTFHQQMSYIHAVYKRFQGSCIEDIILVSAGLLELYDHLLAKSELSHLLP